MTASSDRDPAAAFSATYVEARAKFVVAAHARGLAVETHTHPSQRGAQGEALTIDVAVLGPADARNVLLLTSGTHGAEGFCGSGCQVGLLDDDAFAAKIAGSDVRVVFLHALSECPGVAYAGIALEYGTLPIMDVLKALRADQWLDDHPKASPETRAAIKALVRAAFHDDGPEWQRKVHAQAETAVQAALAGLEAP